MIIGDKIRIENDDTNLSMEWDLVRVPVANHYNGILMPIKVEGKTCDIAFNINKLSNMIGSSNSLVLSYDEPNRALKVLSSKNVEQVEVKPKKEIKKEKVVCNSVTKSIKKESAMKTAIRIVKYSERAIAVVGETKPIKDQLKELGGKWNANLKNEEGTFKGWIFSAKKQQEVEKLIML